VTETATVAPEIVYLKLSELEPHPKNPHGELKKDDPAVLDLKAKIQAVGQKVPCLVRPKGKGYQYVLGHRRAFVRELLGFDDVPCIVEDMTDDMADVLVVQENDSHAPPNAFLEAEVVSDLLARPGWTLESVAQHLGRGKRWVALRANLKNLHPKIRALVDKRKIDWPLEWLEDLARLTPDAQEDLLSTKGAAYRRRLEDVSSKRDLDHLLGDKFHVLGKAPWDLADGTLVPKAGPCATCPKTSLRAPGLFDDAEGDPASPKALKEAICRDSVCWQAKADAVIKAKIAALKKEEPKAEILKGYHTHVPAGVKAREKSYSTEEVKPGTKGAKPAIILDEKSEPKLAYVKERTYGAKPKVDPAKKPDKDEDPKKALARSKKEIAGRRLALFVHKVAGAIVDREKPPAHEVVLGLVAAFSVDEDWEAEELEDTKKAFDLAVKLPAWDKAVWGRVKGAIEQRLDTLSVRRPGTTGEDLDAFVEWIAAILEIDVEKLQAAVLKDIPDPKWWPKLETGPSSLPGMCRGCGCTHDKACPGGCSWVEQPSEQHLSDKSTPGVMLPVGLCSSCAGAQPAGKKKAAKKKAKARA
jgi:ParB/RepB/Spo0J family partition protein